jgi:hypothetical protein
MVIEEEETSLKENSVQVNKITKEQMLSNHELKRSLSEITSKSKNQILSVYDSVNQLFIDDTYASQIVSGDYESYNIPAYKINQDSTVLYNVFLEKQMDGTFESYLLSYYYQNNVDADLNQEVISFSKEQLSTNFQINTDFRTCGLSGVTCNCYTLMREYVDLENYVYRWDYVACTNESIDDGDSASGGGIPSNDPPDSNVPSDPIDSNPIDTNPEENQGSNGGSSDGTATIGATDSNCPQSSVPSLGDGRCGSLSQPVIGDEQFITIDGPEEEITDIADYLAVFDMSSSAVITIQVDQPIPNSSEPFVVDGINVDVGHSFLTIQQGSTVRSFGFYPDGISKPTAPTESGIFGNDQVHEIDVNGNVNATASELSRIITLAIQYSNEDYNLNNQNCTDFVLDASNILGLNFGDAGGTWLLGGGSNPGALGQVLRSQINSGNLNGVTSTGTSPLNSN